ncbi:MAG TPA: hypothetical protein VKZ53_08370 [Candidatus Angelobacter sp.]|nr:hypothetical protein [Candidatus Angelobacter sp.]
MLRRAISMFLVWMVSCVFAMVCAAQRRGTPAYDDAVRAYQQSMERIQPEPPPQNLSTPQVFVPRHPRESLSDTGSSFSTPVDTRPSDCRPQVSYRDRLLTINSENCSLSSILSVVHENTGIRFEGTVHSSLRVRLRIGPGPANAVLKELFKNSPYDYLMVGGHDAPEVVRLWRTSSPAIYRNGLLTVDAPGNTFGEVLDAIQEATGIEFEGVNGIEERIAVRLGPASPSKIIQELFRGSHFNYVMVGDEDLVEQGRKVFLSPLPADGGRDLNQPLPLNSESAPMPSPVQPQPQPVSTFASASVPVRIDAGAPGQNRTANIGGLDTSTGIKPDAPPQPTGNFRKPSFVPPSPAGGASRD